MLNKTFKQKLTLGFLIISVFLGAAFLLSNHREIISSQNQQEQLRANASRVSRFMQADDDGDNLSNGQELLYGSDPQKADTDGDGFKDGREIDNGFDPLRSGSSETAKLSNRPNKTLTVQYLLWAKKLTGAKRPSIDPVLVKQFFDQKGLVNFSLPEINERQITLIESTPANIAGYLEATAKINLPSDSISYSQIASELLTGQGSEQLKLIINGLHQSLTKFTQTPTPAKAKQLQKEYLGLITDLITMFSQLKNIASDPVQISLNQLKGQWLTEIVKQINLNRDQLAKKIEGKNP